MKKSGRRQKGPKQDSGGPRATEEEALTSKSAGNSTSKSVEVAGASHIVPKAQENALYLLEISPEDEAQFPEAVRCLREIAAKLGPHGESMALKEQVEKEVVEVRELSYKVKEKELIIKAVERIMVEQQTSGKYSRFSERFIQTLSRTLTLSKLQQDYEGIGGLFGLEHEFSKLPEQHLESHPEMPELIKAIEETYADVPDIIGATKKLNESKEELLSALIQYHAGRTKITQYRKEMDEMMIKLSGVKKLQMELNEKKFEMMKLEKENDLLKTKIAQHNVELELYGGEKGEAYKILLKKTKKEIEELEESNKQLEEKLKLYASLPQDEFLPILNEYKKVKKDVENAKWSLEKLQQNDSE